MAKLHDFEKELFEKYLQNEISKEEFSRLMQAILHDKVDYDALDSIWEPEAQILNTNERTKLFERILSQANDTEHKQKQIRRLRSKRKKLLFFGIIPILLIIVVIVKLFQPTSEKVIATKFTDLTPGINASLLSTSNGAVYKINAIHQASVVNEYDSIINIPEEATVKFIPIVKNLNAMLASITNTITTQKGNTYKIILPDGSKVWLNASSNLKFPVVFSNSKREVTLEGEGYFEIVKDSKHPFIVHSFGQNVEVLGTHFNINAYNANDITTTLLSGKIAMTHNIYKDQALILQPSDQVVNIANHFNPIDHEIDTTVTVAWKNGLFAFKSTPIKEVLEEIGRWYNADIIYEKELPNKLISGEIYRNTKASEVLELLKYEGIQSKIDGNKIIVTTH